MSTEADADSSRLWVGNLDLRITEFNLLQILQKIGNIEKFDFLYHTKGPLQGQPKGFAFVKYKKLSDTEKALNKLTGTKVGSKHIVVRYAKHVDPEEYERPKPKIEIPVLAAGSSSTKTTSDKKSKIQLIEERLKQMQQSPNDLIINNYKSSSQPESPLIKKYQFNATGQQQQPSSSYKSSLHYKSKQIHKKNVKRKH